jgi:DNA-3-methyladenine glycosylase
VSPISVRSALRRDALPEDTLALARFLIGCTLVRALPEGEAGGRIVETEAYPPGDPAGHAFRGITKRNRSLFRIRGHAYVYIAYGTSFMLNVSSEAEDSGAGVLIRAIEPRFGVALMKARRAGAKLRDLARGPGRLAAALDIDLNLDGLDLCAPGPLFLAASDGDGGKIAASIRIGITRAAERPWRFFLCDSPYVSGPAWLNGGDT